MPFAAKGFETSQVWQSPHAGSGHTNWAVLESWKWDAASSSKLKLNTSIEVLRPRKGGRKGPEKRRFMGLGDFFPPSLGVMKEEIEFCGLFQYSLITVEL